MIELTEIESKLYDSKVQYGYNRLALRQLCCHPLISDKERNILGNISHPNIRIDIIQIIFIIC